MGEDKPKKKISVVRVTCTCAKVFGKRVEDNPKCPVSLHNDVVDSIFDELNIDSSILDT